MSRSDAKDWRSLRGSGKPAENEADRVTTRLTILVRRFCPERTRGVFVPRFARMIRTRAVPFASLS